MEGIKQKLVDIFLNYGDRVDQIRVFVIALIFLLIYTLYRAMIKAQMSEKVLHWIDGTIQKSSGKLFLDWTEMREKMIRQGLEFYNPKFLEPHYFILIHFVVIVIGVGMVYAFAGLAPAILGVGAVFLPTWYFGHRDKKDNEKMIQDVMTISSALSIQVVGGEYLGIALAECKDMVQHKRLINALVEFDSHMTMGDLTLVENIDEFGSKFNSDEIIALCTILKQGIETGKMVECAADLNKQCMTVRETGFDAKKGHLDRLITIGMLMIFADGLGFILWRFLASIMNNM